MGHLALATQRPDSAEAQPTLKRRAAGASVATSLVLAVIKLAAGFASASLALLSEGAHNALDIGASALTFVAVREADKPADALHFSSDLISSVLVLLGLAATRAGYPHADAVAAIGVAGFIAVAGYRLGRATIDALVDRAPEGLADAMRALVAQTRGVAGAEAIRLRTSGARIVGELIVSVSRTLPLERVAAIKADLATRIGQRWPQADLTITANPIALDDETILERVQLIATSRRLPVHHVTIQDIDGRKSVALDLEVDGALTLSAAHSIASDLEEAIAAEVGEGVEVETHIEPAEPEAHSQDADLDLARRIQASLAAAAAQGPLRDIHDVRVRESPGGLFVLFHCRVDPATTVEAVHKAVDTLERLVREAFPEVRRAVGHAEPAREGAR